MSASIISLNGDILAKNGRILKSLNGGGGGSSYSAGPGIDITNNTVSVKYDTDGLLTTENQIEGEYSSGRFDRVDHFVQARPFHNFGDIQQYLVQDRTYTVKLASHHNGDWEQGRGYAVSKSSTSMTWNMMMIMMGFMWDDTGYIDVSQGWDYEDGATEESWADYNISNCQLQLTDDVTGDVYYSSDFYSDELIAFYASDGKLKVRIEKGNNNDDILRWNSNEQKWVAAGLDIPNTVEAKKIWDGGYETYTSNDVTIAPDFDNDEDWSRWFDLQGYAHCTEVQMYGKFEGDGTTEASNNVPTTVTLVIENRYDNTDTYTLALNAKQFAKNYVVDPEGSAIQRYGITFTTEEFQVPFDCSIRKGDSSQYYLKSIHVSFARLTSGCTALTPDSKSIAFRSTTYPYNS
jgi:hypothetical protein